MTTKPDVLAIGAQHLQASDWPKAEQVYREILQDDPTDARVWYLLGAVSQLQGRHDEAIVCYREALGLDPTYAAALSNLGLALQTQGWLDDAVDCYRHALSLNSDFADAHANL